MIKNKENEKLSGFDWIGLLLFLMIVAGGGYVLYYQIIHKVTTCTSNPVNYLIEQQIEQGYLEGGINYSRIQIYFYEDKDSVFPLEKLDFYSRSKK